MKKQIGFNEIQIKQLIDVIDQRMDIKFKKELRPIKTQLKGLRGDINMVIGSFDRQILSQGKRIDNIENILHISSF